MSVLTTNLVQLSTTLDPGIGFYSYIIQTSTGNYYDSTSATFVPFSNAVTPKIPFTEYPTGSGNYTWTITLNATTWPNGIYNIGSFEHTSNLVAAQLYPIYIFNGMAPADYNATLVTLNQNYPGTGDMTYVDTNGNGIFGASIQVFTQLDYNAGNLSDPLGETTTDNNGNWLVPIQVPAGGTYTVLFQLLYQFGPDPVNVTT